MLQVVRGPLCAEICHFLCSHSCRALPRHANINIYGTCSCKGPWDCPCMHALEHALHWCHAQGMLWHPADTAPTQDICPVWHDVCLPQKCSAQSNLTAQLGTCKLHIINTPVLSATQPYTEAWETSKCGATVILFIWQVNCGYP